MPVPPADQLQRFGASVLTCGSGKGDLQVNLVDKHHRSRQSHEIAVSLRDRIEAIGKKNGGLPKSLKCRRIPLVISPIVAEIYGPDMNGQMAVGKQVRAAFEKNCRYCRY